MRTVCKKEKQEVRDRPDSALLAGRKAGADGTAQGKGASPHFPVPVPLSKEVPREKGA